MASSDADFDGAVAYWPALLVDEIDEKKLLKSRTSSYDLPVKTVPTSDIQQVAVLSWRWDGKYRVWGSRNVVSAVYLAKKWGIKYLFIDAISIDQSLRGAELMGQITTFSRLYKTIPVIVAYDKIGEDFRKTMRRPWILIEVRAFRYNPNPIVYIGHSNQGLASTRISGDSDDVSEVATPLLFIIPGFAEVLTAAYEQMPRNDYLLTAAILCQAHSQSIKVNEDNIAGVRFEKYEYLLRGESDSIYDGDFFLDKQKVAVWDQQDDSHVRICKFSTLRCAENAIFAFLGLPDTYYEDFIAHDEERRKDVRSVLEVDVPIPRVELASCDILFGTPRG